MREDHIEHADGSRGVYSVVDKPDFALVVPMQNDGFHLVEQYRYTVGRRSWGFPSGSFPPGMSGTSEEMAVAELAEETGLRAGRFEKLGYLHCANGMTGEGVHVFLATDLTPGEPDREQTEQDMVQRWFPRRELEQMLRDGTITDSPTLGAYLLLTLRGTRRGWCPRPPTPAVPSSEDLVLNHELAAAELTEGYDRVILATGSTPLQPARWAPDAPALPGADQWNVYAPEDVLGGRVELPRRVLVLDDTGDRQALVVADYLAEKRHPVQVVMAYPQIAHQTAGSFDLGFVYGSLRRRGVTFTTHSLVTEIDGDEVILTDVHTRETTRLENVDAVVLSLGNAANDGLSNELAALGVATTSIGDCQSPRRIFNAIWEGEHAGLAV